MTAPIGSFNTNYGRFYSHPSSRSSTETKSVLSQFVNNPLDETGPYAPRPSITNIINVINEEFLPPYYAKLVAEYAVDHLDGIQDNIDTFGRDVAVGNLKNIVNRPHPAGPIGDEVHNAIDKFFRSEELPEFSTTTARQMFAQFRGFYREYQPEVVKTEYTVWSYKHGYAGTGDLMWYHDGKLCIVDTKTGTQVRPKVALQTAAIANADVILNEDGTELPIDWESELYVLHVRPRSVKLHKIENQDTAWETFLACKRIFDWKRFESHNHISPNPFKVSNGRIVLWICRKFATPWMFSIPWTRTNRSST